ncbi:uncharacterized protein HaLaN_16405 [Haematococcus lacustris]|uniref:Uncharacterized protein n=1 Tax=Haematococcus lacustris TaxID=44745 RepID=A0A699ZLN8_HAELA|nr:uncharacterized protein HaLaN_16405 [Haematococcus lacustris]
MDAGRLRNLYTQAQLLVAELRALPLDNNRESFPRIIELVRLVKRLEDSAHDLTSDAADVLAQRAAWLQRATWLREDVASLAQERVHSPDTKQFFLNLLLLLYAGVDAMEGLAQQKPAAHLILQAELETALHASEQAKQQLAQRLAAAEAAQADVGEGLGQIRHVSVPRSLLEEALEARSKLVVAQQQLAAREGAGEDAGRRLQALKAEVEQLRVQVVELREENCSHQQLAEERLEVIRVLMERTEGQAASLSERAALASQVTNLQSSLEANASVVDKLIGLNTELMERHNALAVRLHHAAHGGGGVSSHGQSGSGGDLRASSPAATDDSWHLVSSSDDSSDRFPSRPDTPALHPLLTDEHYSDGPATPESERLADSVLGQPLPRNASAASFTASRLASSAKEGGVQGGLPLGPSRLPYPNLLLCGLGATTVVAVVGAVGLWLRCISLASSLQQRDKEALQFPRTSAPLLRHTAIHNSWAGGHLVTTNLM